MEHQWVPHTTSEGTFIICDFCEVRKSECTDEYCDGDISYRSPDIDSGVNPFLFVLVVFAFMSTIIYIIENMSKWCNW